MLRSLRTFASLALLFVLTGGPLATIVCAEWCAPFDSASGSSTHHHLQAGALASAPASPAAVADCHRTQSNLPAVTAHVIPECLDYALTGNDAGPVAPRLQIAPPMSQATAIVTNAARTTIREVRLSTDVVHALPSRPLAASPILRI